MQGQFLPCRRGGDPGVGVAGGPAAGGPGLAKTQEQGRAAPTPTVWTPEMGTETMGTIPNSKCCPEATARNRARERKEQGERERERWRERERVRENAEKRPGRTAL
eukprot:8322012-Pyramimonas_sp.AAC.1